MATPQAYRQGVSTELSHLSIGGKKLFKLLMQINIRTVTGGSRIERKIRKLTSILISLRHLCFYWMHSGKKCKLQKFFALVPGCHRDAQRALSCPPSPCATLMVSRRAAPCTQWLHFLQWWRHSFTKPCICFLISQSSTSERHVKQSRTSSSPGRKFDTHCIFSFNQCRREKADVERRSATFFTFPVRVWRCQNACWVSFSQNDIVFIWSHVWRNVHKVLLWTIIVQFFGDFVETFPTVILARLNLL
jgi:hypothetical protein